MKQVPTDKIRNVVLVGHSGSGKTTLAEALLYEAGAISRIGPGRGRHHRVRRRARGAATPPVADPGRGALRVERPQDQPDRHAGLRRLRGRGAGRHAGGRPGRVRGQRGRRGRGADRDAVADRRPSWGCPAWSSSTSSTGSASSFERTLDEIRAAFGAGVAPLELPIGEEVVVLRRGRSADRHRLHLRPGPERGRRAPPSTPLGRDPRRHGGARAPGARQPGRGHRGGRRRAARALPRGRDAVARAARAHAGPRARRGHRVPGGVRLGHRPGRHRPPGRPDLRDRAVAARPTPGRGGGRRHRGRHRPGRRRPAAGLGVQDHRRSPRGPDLAAQGAVGHDAAATSTWSTPGPGPTSGSTGCSPSAAASTST